MCNTVSMRRVALPLLLWLLVGTAAVPRAEEMATASSTESTTEEAPQATPAAIQGPLFHVTTGDDPTGEVAPEDPEDIRAIYAEGDEVFLQAFWWWVVGVAGLAGIGALAWWIWGNRQPRRASRL